MYNPISHLDDCNLNHYNLQLSIYMYIIKTDENSRADAIIIFPKLITPQITTNFIFIQIILIKSNNVFNQPIRSKYY